MADKDATIRLGLDNKPLDDGTREAKKKLTGLFSDLRGLSGKIAVGQMMGNAATAGFAKLTDFIGGVVSSSLDFEKQLTRLQIAGGRTAGGMNKLREKISEVSKATSVSRNDLLAGTAAYVRMTGDLKGGEEALETFGKVAVASGSSMEDIASTAAALRQNLKIDPKDFKGAFDILITQGKAGAIELNELASLMAGIAPTFAKFKGGTGVKGMAQLGAALQVSRQAFGTSSEAVTGLRAFQTSITRNAKKFGKNNIFETIKKNGKSVTVMRSFADIIDRIGASKLAQDDTALVQAFGSTEAQRFFDVIKNNRGMLDSLTREAMGSNAVDKDSAEYLTSTAGKLELAINAAKVAMADAFTPERIAGFVNAVGKLAGWFGDIVGFVDYLGDRMAPWERKQQSIVERGNKSAEREKKALVDKHWEKTKAGMSGQEIGEMYGASTAGGFPLAGDAAVAAKQEELIRKRLAGGTDRDVEAMLRREGVIREALGGVGNMGSGGRQSAPFRGGLDKDISAAGALALSGEVTRASDRDALIKQQAAAIAKAMAAEVAKFDLIVRTSNEATGEKTANSKNGRTKPGGKN